MRGVLCLEDGFSVQGELLNYHGETAGEVVFFTGMCGYEEALTDPAYRGQIVVFTFPMTGAYGLPAGSGQSHGLTVKGLVARDVWTGPVDDTSTPIINGLERANCPALHGVNTRELVIHLREHGCKRGVVAALPDSGVEQAIAQLKERASRFDMRGIVDEAACQAPAEVRATQECPRGTCVLVDFGVKAAVISEISGLGYRIVRVPPRAAAGDILKWDPTCVMLSSGPGDPEDNQEAIDAVSGILGKVPVFGISLGHQIIAKAAGSRLVKLKFGHHGAQPVKDLSTGRAVGTSQNHNYAVDDSVIPAGLKVTHLNLNDGTVEGLEIRESGGSKVLATSVQFNPEGAPGPVYRQFWALLQGGHVNA